LFCVAKANNVVVSDLQLSGVKKGDFGEDQQAAFVAVVALELGVDESDVTIVGIEEVPAARRQRQRQLAGDASAGSGDGGGGAAAAAAVPALKITLRVEQPAARAAGVAVALSELVTKDTSALAAKLGDAMGLPVTVKALSLPTVTSSEGASVEVPALVAVLPDPLLDPPPPPEGGGSPGLVVGAVVGVLAALAIVLIMKYAWPMLKNSEALKIKAKTDPKRYSNTVIPLTPPGPSRDEEKEGEDDDGPAQPVLNRGADGQVLLPTMMDLEASAKRRFKKAVNTVQASRAFESEGQVAEQKRAGRLNAAWAGAGASASASAGTWADYSDRTPPASPRSNLPLQLKCSPRMSALGMSLPSDSTATAGANVLPEASELPSVVGATAPLATATPKEGGSASSLLREEQPASRRRLGPQISDLPSSVKPRESLDV
jgi:hypothetical protein